MTRCLRTPNVVNYTAGTPIAGAPIDVVVPVTASSFVIQIRENAAATIAFRDSAIPSAIFTLKAGSIYSADELKLATDCHLTVVTADGNHVEMAWWDS